MIGRKLFINVGIVTNHVRVEEKQISNDYDLYCGNQNIEVLSRLLLLDQREQTFKEDVVPY